MAMEASPLPRHHLPPPPTSEKIKENLFKNGIKNPPPKIIHTLRKKQKQKQKELRKLSKKNHQDTTLTQAQEREIAEETHFQAIKSEYREIMVGNPWEGGERVKMREILGSEGGFGLKREYLKEFGGFLQRERERFKWLLDDDVEEREEREWVPKERRGGESEAIRFLVEKLSSTQLNVKDYKFSKMMKQSKLSFTESQLLKIVGGLGNIGQWKHALSVVEWVYGSKEHRSFKTRMKTEDEIIDELLLVPPNTIIFILTSPYHDISKNPFEHSGFVYTKLLAVLGKAQRPREALQIFYRMADDAQIYPDMAAYHSIAVTLGQNGYLKELIKIIETMSEKPSRRTKNFRHKNWDPTLQPDVVVFNAVLNACVPSHQWKGVSWVFQQLRKHGLKPNGPTYGLAMEVMLHSGKYDLVHEFFEKMKRSGEAPKALTYKVLVSSFWQEDRVDKAVEAVRDMEKRGVVGGASVYYELVCCLCNKGRWQEAMLEVEKLKRLKHSKPLQVTFTGMIMSSLDGGHVRSCISIFEQSKNHCDIDIGLINAMLKVYGSNDMFSKAKEIFEVTKRSINDTYENMNDFGSALNPDAYTYVMMLKASASAQQWDYFEFVYRDMVLSGYVIDQSKHGSLLVEASKAGKWLLLEHAFDMILEAGEIPHLSFFTELICQALVHHNIERGISLIKALAYAPSQISEKQWLDFFERNADRVSSENLYELLESLKKSELPKEATVSNLSRSVIAYCKKVPNSDEDTDMNGTIVNSSGIFLCDDLHDESRRDSANVTYSESDEEGDALPTMSKSFDHVCDEEREAVDKCTALENIDFSNMFDEGDDDDFDCIESDNEAIKDMQFDIRGVTNGSDQPSANEILESWKQSREKEGFFSKFSVS